MYKTLLLATAPFLAVLPAGAQDIAYQGAGIDLGFVTVDEGPQVGVDGSVTSDLHFGAHLGLQGDIGIQYLGLDGDSRGAARISLHPYLRLNQSLVVGAYVEGWATTDNPATAIGAEVSWQHESGFSAELYLGETHGDELEDDGYASSRGAVLGYTTATDIRGTLYFNKDTTSEQGRTDRDFYDYGASIDIPVGPDGATRLSVGLGQVRFDADNRSDGKFTFGVTRQLGGDQSRPTFSRQRSVLTGLLGY